MPSITIEKQLFIEPQYLSRDIENVIRKKVEGEFLGSCDKDYGYITSVKNIEIIDNTVSRSCNGIFFQVRFQADCIKPQEGQEYIGKVSIVIHNCILVNSSGMTIVVSSNKMPGYVYCNDSFQPKGSLQKKKKVIQVDSTVTTILEKIKHDGNNFQCVGRLKD